MSTSRRQRVLFFGTPNFVVPCLEVLVRNPLFEVVGVFTQPDKPKGRGKNLSAPAIKLFAEKHGIAVFQPEKLAHDRVITELRNLAADVAVTAAYGKIIPQAVLSIPRLGFLNIHPSLLPVLRGPSPLQFALWHDITPTGVTIIKMDAGMDTGPILTQSSYVPRPEDDFFSLSQHLFALGAADLEGALPDYLSGKIKLLPQDDKKSTTCRLLTKEDGRVNFTETAEEIERRVRAFALWPGVFCIRKKDGLRVKLIQVSVQKNTDLKAALCIPCVHGSWLIVEKLQPEGKKVMTASEFIRGFGRDLI